MTSWTIDSSPNKAFNASQDKQDFQQLMRDFAYTSLSEDPMVTLFCTFCL